MNNWLTLIDAAAELINLTTALITLAAALTDRTNRPGKDSTDQ